ncbi:LORF2 protein, partial [Crocuta crocuta]
PFIEVLASSLSSKSKQPKCPSLDEWIKKMWYISHTRTHSGKEKNEILPFITTWMHLEDITLNEISQRKPI